MDFRGIETLSSYNFKLSYSDDDKSEYRSISWTQVENPFTLKSKLATISNVVMKRNGGDIMTNWMTSYTRFDGLSISQGFQK